MEKETENDQEITQQGSEKNSAVDVEEHESKATDCSPTFDFTETSWRTGDFILNVEGTKLHVAKNILALASPVFDRMFQSEFKEKEKEELDLPGKKLEDVVEFLRCIYPNFFVPINHENALRLLPLFDEYQVFHLKVRCEHALVESVTDEMPVEELFQRLQEADMYNLKELREKCITLAIGKPHEELIKATEACRPPADTLATLFKDVTTKMAEKLEELQSENEEMTSKIKTLEIDAKMGRKMKEIEESYAKVIEEFDLATTYISLQVRRSKELLFGEGINWMIEHAVLSVHASNKYASSIQKMIWGVPINISTTSIVRREYSETARCYFSYNWLLVQIKHARNGSFFCHVNTRCDLVNKLPTGENVSICRKTTLMNSDPINIDIKKTDEIYSASQGFICDGKLGLIVHVYMSEPNKST